MIKIKTELDYFLENVPEAERKQTKRRQTSQCVINAIASKYPEGMDTDDMMFWGPIQRKFSDNKGTIELEENQFDRLYVCVKECKKWPVQLILMAPVLIEYLEKVRHSIGPKEVKG